MSSKTIVLITGANAGIGFETVKALLQSSRPYHILVGSRSLDKGKAAVEAVQKEFPNTTSSLEAIAVELGSDESIQKAFELVKEHYGHLDVLVNNAGAGFDSEVVSGALGMREAWNKTYDVNVSGTQVLTYSFAPLLIASSSPRILFITSGTSTLERVAEIITSGGGRLNQNIPAGGAWPKPPVREFPSYQCSKTALNMLMVNWSRILKNDGVKCWAIAPGLLATGWGGYGAEEMKTWGAGHPSLGGVFITSVIDGARDADVGKVVDSNGIQPW